MTAQSLNLGGLLLAVDVGNSRVKLGLFADGRLLKTDHCPTRDIRSKPVWLEEISSFLRAMGMDLRNLNGLAIASVVPRKSRGLLSAVGRVPRIKVVLVSAETYPYRVDYRTPLTLGADRLCDAAGAFQRVGGPVVVVDFGTAVTVNAVGADGAFLGGAILPGPFLTAAALARRTVQLPKVAPDFPPLAIGRDTAEGIASGATYGLAALADGMIERFEREIGAPVKTLATGGAGEAFVAHCRRLEEYLPNLTLEGAAAIFRASRAAA